MVAMIFAAVETPQQVECTNCFDYTGRAGVILALAALVVSALSLYVSALKRAKIEVDHVSHGAELGFTGWAGPTRTGRDGPRHAQEIHVPIAFERGEARALELHGKLLIRDPQNIHEFARQLRQLESVEFEVVYMYLRPGFFRRGRKRTVLKRDQIKVDAGHLQETAKTQWEQHEAYAEEARILAGES